MIWALFRRVVGDPLARRFGIAVCFALGLIRGGNEIDMLFRGESRGNGITVLQGVVDRPMLGQQFLTRGVLGKDTGAVVHDAPPNVIANVAISVSLDLEATS